MRAAMLRLAAGQSTGPLPYEAWEHIIAARYGQTPEQVRDWPADDFLRAIALERLTRG